MGPWKVDQWAMKNDIVIRVTRAQFKIKIHAPGCAKRQRLNRQEIFNVAAAIVTDTTFKKTYQDSKKPESCSVVTYFKRIDSKQKQERH